MYYTTFFYTNNNFFLVFLFYSLSINYLLDLEKCLDGAVEGFQKNAGISLGISNIFKSLMQCKISVNHYKNRSIQVLRIIKKILRNSQLFTDISIGG